MTTGSLVNNLYGNASYPAPEVGMGATILYWTDRHAATIVTVGKGWVEVREDIATRTDANGMSDAQSYSYAPNPNATPRRFSLRKNGAWVEVGSKARSGTRLAIGARKHYHDYGF